MSSKWIVSAAGGRRVATVYIDGKQFVTNDTNPAFGDILDRLRDNDLENIEELFDAERGLTKRFEKLSDRVAVRNGKVYFDGDPIENDLSDHLLRVMRDGKDVAPLVNFWERIAANPLEHSRENLLRWLKATQGFTITSEGLILGYKGLRQDYTSVSAGPGVVNGVEVNGNLDNTVGNVVEIARSQVNHNPRVGCASGLHVGTWDYARSFGHGIVVEVLVDPRDVVSVPTDCNGQKMRVCRYKVVGNATGNRPDSVIEDYDEDDFAETDYADGAWAPFNVA